MDNLTSLLDKATSLTLELLDVLSEERAALSQPDIAILETVIEKKLLWQSWAPRLARRV